MSSPKTSPEPLQPVHSSCGSCEVGTVFYQCQRCTACCRWPGQVKVDEEEIAAMADFLNMTEQDFIEEYTQLRPDRRGLRLTEQPGGACIFLEDNACRVNPAKPRQCAGFPNTWNFAGWREICKAVPMLKEHGTGKLTPLTQNHLTDL